MGNLGKEYCNRKAQVGYHGKIFCFNENDYSSFGNWHGKKDPGSFVCESVVREAKNRWLELPRNKTIELSAMVLGVSVEKLEHSLEWSAGYMAWHEGGEAGFYHVWPKDEQY